MLTVERSNASKPWMNKYYSLNTESIHHAALDFETFGDVTGVIERAQTERPL